MIPSSSGRANYLKKVFHHVGNNCSVMDRKVPLYPELISLGNNVHLASHVFLTTHDAIHRMINSYEKARGGKRRASETVGCIQIGDNVFIGSGTRILGNVRIGSNVIVAASALVNKDIPDNSVAAGVPARVIGTFDSFIEKRLGESKKDWENMGGGENVSPEVANMLWNDFIHLRV